MKARTARILATLPLLVWGVVMIQFYVSGRIDIYVAPEFRMYSLVAGLGLCVLALFNLLTSRVEVDCGHDHHDHDHDHDHGDDESHDHTVPVTGPMPLFFLTVPIVVAVFASQDGFSKTAVVNKGLYSVDYENSQVGRSAALNLTPGGGAASDAVPVEPVDTAMPSATDTVDVTVTALDEEPGVMPVAEAPGGEEEAPEDPADAYGEYTLADLEAQVDKSAEGHYLLTVPQLFYTAGDEELQRVIKGLPVETVGQVMPEQVNNPNGTRLRVFRLFIECCAADARPLSIPIEFGKEPPTFEEMGWVKIVGTMDYLNEDGMTVPVLEVKIMESTAPPEDEMIF